MRLTPTIRATVTFLSREEDGRSSMPGLSTGQYMPHLVIQSPEVRSAIYIHDKVCVEDYLGVRFVSSPEALLPSHPLDCQMELMYFPNVTYDAVRAGATFTIREGPMVVGYGVIESRSG